MELGFADEFFSLLNKFKPKENEIYELFKEWSLKEFVDDSDSTLCANCGGISIRKIKASTYRIEFCNACKLGFVLCRGTVRAKRTIKSFNEWQGNRGHYIRYFDERGEQDFIHLNIYLNMNLKKKNLQKKNLNDSLIR